MGVGEIMEYWIWLQSILRAGSAQVKPVLERYGNAKGVYNASYDDLKLSGLFKETQLAKLSDKDLSFAMKVLNDCKNMGISLVCINNSHYPSLLREIENPPLLLYFKGNIDLLNGQPTICIVGPRAVSAFGNKAAFSLSARLASGGFTIVSGGALGSDSAAHKGALAVNGNTICVLGSGINSSYLKENKPLRDTIAKQGILISEFFPNQNATKYTFPIRNRIMSGLSHGTVVIEAGDKSGALITANLANEQGRDVFVIPGNPTYLQYKGSNKLIRDGASALLDTGDIFQEYIVRFPDKIFPEKAFATQVVMTAESKEKTSAKTGPETAELPRKEKIKKNITDNLSKTAKIVYNQLDKQIFLIDEIDCGQLSLGEVLAAVTELEIFGYIEALPGGRYGLK